jgi:integrase
VSEDWGDILAIVLRQFARELGTIKVHGVTTKMIKIYMDEQEWGVRHFNAMRAAIAEFFTWAAEEDQKYTRAPNPVKPVKRRRKIKGEDDFEKIVVPPPWVRNRLLEVSTEHPEFEMTPYFVLLFYFGCRSSEALGADWIDYNPALDHLAPRTK